MSINEPDLENALVAVREQNPHPEDDAIEVQDEYVIGELLEQVGITLHVANDLLIDVARILPPPDYLYVDKEAQELIFYFDLAISRKRKHEYAPSFEEAPDWLPRVAIDESETHGDTLLETQDDISVSIAQVILYFATELQALEFQTLLETQKEVTVNQPTQHRLVITTRDWNRQEANWKDA